MKTVEKQVRDYFASLNSEVEFEYTDDGFTANVLDMVHKGRPICSVLICWFADGINMFSVSVMLNTVNVTDELRYILNQYNNETYGWKALIDTDENGDPYVSFECEYECVQTERIYDVLESAFEELTHEENEEYFFELCDAQID